MKHTKRILIAVTAIVLIGLLAACGGGNADQPTISDADAVLTQAAEIAMQGLTQTAEAAPPTSTPLPPAATSAPTQSPTQTVVTVPTNAIDLTVSPTTDPNAGQGTTTQPTATTGAAVQVTATTAPITQPTTAPIAGDIDCYKASYGSESPPYDYTKIAAGKTFTKTWRLKNSGTCPWTRQVDVVWVSTTLNGTEVSELFGASSVISFVPEEGIQPQDYGEITVTFTVPATYGVYQMFFMLRSPAGVFYVDGGAFWFIIESIDPN